MISEIHADKLYQETLRFIDTLGCLTQPRGFSCIELSPFHIRLTNPLNNIVSNPLRKINKAFAAAELTWILQGRNDVEYLDQFNSKIKQFSDDGVTFFGAYGPKYVDQVDYIIQTLKRDPWSRQAVMTIWRENPPPTKDVPCTVMFHFLQRPLGVLNLIVYMRSQDCWLGLPYDLHNFTCIQIIVAYILNLRVGVFDLMQGSLHAYEQDMPKIRELIRNPLPTEVESTPERLEFLVNQKQNWMIDYATNKLRVRT